MHKDACDARPIRLRRPRPKACTTRATSTTPAASASSSTSRGAVARHRPARRCRCSSTSSTAARAAARRTPVTARASWCRCRTVPAQGGAPRHRPAAGRRVRRRPGVPAARRGERDAVRQLIDADRRRRRPDAARLARGADRRQHWWAERGGRRAGRSSRCSSLRRRRAGRPPLTADPLRFERKLYVIRKRIEHAVDAAGARRERRSCSTSCSLSSQDAHLQGDADGRPDRADVPRSDAIRTSSRRSRSCISGSAPTRSRRGRWRTRTASSRTTARSTRCRQHQLDARPRGAAPVDVFGDDLQKILPVIREGGSDTATFDNVLEFLAHDRALAAARDPDDDPGAVAEPRDDDAGAQGVLRVPLVADGAVGRPGVDRVLRRHA